MRSDYKPNEVSVSQRVANIIVALFLLGYGAYGIWIDDLIVPTGKRSSIHLHGFAVWTTYAAFICAAIVLLAEVIDHYDQRDNENNYRLFSNIFKYLGLGFLAVSLISALIKPV